ncbi:MAG: DeoR/GlpR transcriptional regulator [Rhodospirillales bacterium]|nr:DeoR/GlpR transcriptional regulator [Rhodospirillales bacterium]
MTPDGRRQEIVAVVMREGSVQIDSLAERLDVSRMTVHRDLDLLEQQGLLRKERGMATAESSLLFESNFHYRIQVAAEDKQALAKAAAKLVEPGNVVMIDESTTTLPLADALSSMEALTVISNSLAVQEKVRDLPNIRMLAPGGLYNAKQKAFYGLICEHSFGKLRADWAFLSSSSVIGTSLYHQEPEVIRVKRAIMDSAERRVLLVTANKFSIRALNHYAELAEFDHVFIKGPIDEAIVNRLQQAGIHFETI